MLLQTSGNAAVLIVMHVYSPESVSEVSVTLSVFIKVTSIDICSVIATLSLSAWTTVPLWVHSILGHGNPSALHSNTKFSDLVTLIFSGDWINTGMTKKGIIIVIPCDQNNFNAPLTVVVAESEPARFSAVH